MDRISDTLQKKPGNQKSDFRQVVQAAKDLPLPAKLP